MESLHSLTGDKVVLQSLFDACAVDPETGEVTVPEELLARLDAIEIPYQDKVEACGLRVLGLEAVASMLLEESRRLVVRAERVQAEADRLSEALRRSLVATNTRQVKAPKCTVSLRQGSERVEVVDLAAVPAEFRRAPKPPPPPAEWPPDKEAVKPLLKAGQAIPGLVIVRGEPTVTVK